MITLLSGPFKIITFSLLKVVDPPNCPLKFNMADVKLSLRVRLPTFQTSWDHVIVQHLRCGLGNLSLFFTLKIQFSKQFYLILMAVNSVLICRHGTF